MAEVREIINFLDRFTRTIIVIAAPYVFAIAIGNRQFRIEELIIALHLSTQAFNEIYNLHPAVGRLWLIAFAMMIMASRLGF